MLLKTAQDANETVQLVKHLEPLICAYRREIRGNESKLVMIEVTPYGIKIHELHKRGLINKHG